MHKVMDIYFNKNILAHMGRQFGGYNLGIFMGIWEAVMEKVDPWKRLDVSE